MNVLILSGEFGMGHKMAARAIAEQIQQLDKQANITELDLFANFYPRSSGLIFKAFHMVVEHCHGIYNLVYKLSGKLEVNVKPFGIKIYQKLQGIIDQYKPDVIVCTLPFCAKSIASYIDKTGCKIPLVTCITDISVHPEWITSQTDTYLVATREIKEHLIRKGEDPENIYVTGIPVRQQFLNYIGANERQCKIRKILVMGGGLGVLPEMDKLLRFLHESPGLSTTVITGKNQKAYKKWKDCYDNIQVLGYTDSICDYMKNADLVISKVGGITLFELVQCEVPLFVIHPFLEQEINNAKYVQEANIGKVVWDKSEDYIPALKNLLTNEREWQNMKDCMRYVKNEMIDMELAEAMRLVLERASA